MAVKELKSITVIKGPMALGKTFAFRIGKDKETKDGEAIRGSGKVEIGDDPVVLKLDTPEAARVNLQKSVLSMVQKGYLTDVNAPQRQKSTAKGGV